MISKTRRTILQTLATSTAGLMVGPLRAQEGWPTRQIRIVVPVAAGGIIDLVSRNLAEALRVPLGVPIIVESRPGADHIIGTQFVAKSDPDGYTWLCGSVPFTTTPHLLSKPPFAPLQDFKPVALLATSPNVLVVPTTLGVRTIKELIALGRSKSDGLTYVNPGNGSSNHLGTEQLRAATDLAMTGILYKGQPPAVVDLLSGRVDFMVMSSSLATPHIKAGKLVPLASVASQRLPQLPDVPTMKEVGFESVTVIPWFGILVPAATPGAIVERIHREIRGAAATDAYRAGIDRIGAVPALDQSSADFAAMLRAEYDQWPALFERAGITKS
ncbi:MAG: tripartite tricarboxylate transporter substrate binding protein [Acidobacteria bacterium]|nr:tripartite tricarboxylate transporter substrate binding protein [Acidobacteriota bacterium]